jgi:chemotaxis protein methyltransferase CheR
VAANLDLGRLTQWAAERLGFDQRALRMDRLAEVAAREQERLGSAEAVIQAMAAGDAKLEAALVGAITVGETYFFRQREHFDLLAQLPALSRGRVLAWSAGCSTGEEAYSLAAMLRSFGHLEAPQLTVWGTDINDASLAQARSHEYGRWSWRDTSPVAVKVLQSQALDEPNRACVRFAKHNLLESPVFDGGVGERFDVVFCRNVLVYFSPLAAARALQSMADAIVPGGWLVLGNTDLPGSTIGFKRIGPPALCVYAKDLPPPPRHGRNAAELADLPPAPRRPPPPPVKLLADGAQADPVAWHGSILAQIEQGLRAGALKELAHLVERHPDYLPGRFEHALALRRAGHGFAAAVELKKILDQVKGRSLDEMVPGPEPLSLEYYVNSAQSFISSSGGGQ